jgi:hypothetical protein
MKVYFRTILVGVVFFGFISAIIMADVYELKIYNYYAWLPGVLFGFFLSLLALSIHTFIVYSMEYDDFKEAIEVSHTRKLILQSSLDDAFEQCFNYVKSLNCWMYVITDDRINGLLEICLGNSLWTNDDIVRFKFMQIDKTYTEVEITCRLMSWMSLVDNGRNLARITSIVKYLSNENRIQA